MIYSLLVLASPISGHGSLTALNFAKAVTNRGNQIHRIFFLDEGVMAGASCCVTPQDEINPTQQWADLAAREGIELILCVSSALKRGLLDASEAQRYEKEAETVHPSFQISGLGQLIDAAATSDRLVTFGG